MKSIELGKNKKIRISFKEQSNLTFSSQEKLDRIFHSDCSINISENRNFILEMLLPSNASYYALLGAKYIFKSESDNLLVEIKYIDSNLENYKDTIVPYNKETVFKGITKEYVESISEAVTDYFQYNNIPKGKIVFDVAANCEVGSSPKIFKIVTKILLEILLNKYYPTSDNEIKKICENRLSPSK